MHQVSWITYSSILKEQSFWLWKNFRLLRINFAPWLLKDLVKTLSIYHLRMDIRTLEGPINMGRIRPGHIDELDLNELRKVGWIEGKNTKWMTVIDVSGNPLSKPVVNDRRIKADQKWTSVSKRTIAGEQKLFPLTDQNMKARFVDSRFTSEIIVFIWNFRFGRSPLAPNKKK